MDFETIELLKELGLDPSELETITAGMRRLLSEAGVSSKLIGEMLPAPNVLQQATAQVFSPQDPALAELTTSLISRRG